MASCATLRTGMNCMACIILGHWIGRCFWSKRGKLHVTKKAVCKVVKECELCQSIKSAPNVHNLGEIQIAGNWKRLAVDITFYCNGVCLSINDCRLGRISLLQKIRTEMVAAVK